MSQKGHVRGELYRLSEESPGAGSCLALAIHEHRLELCEVCRKKWDRLAGLQEEYLARLRRLVVRPDPQAAPPLIDLPGSRAELRSQEEKVANRSANLLHAKRALQALLRTPREQRARRIRRSHCRFQSRLLAELLLDTCRSRVSGDPAEAQNLAELVPLVLDWARGDGASRWARALFARAAAHRANALRVAGDLPQAEAAFVDLRRQIGTGAVGDAAALGEIASLEASLRIGQRRLDEAEALLERAVLAYRAGGDIGGLARAHIQQGTLMRTRQRPRAAYAALAAAASALPAEADPYLFLCTVTGRVNALCDLGRYAEAGELLAAHLDAYEDSDRAHAPAILRCLQGRVRLGLERWDAAAGSFAAAGAAMRALDRHHDAALLALYEAEAYHGAGRRADLRRLAGGLVRLFRGQGVESEALRALQLFRKAVAAETVSVKLLSECRRRIEQAGSAIAA